ncbi:MAG: ABC transporter ATP-binding protein [Clostridiales bacterium]|nr:ABC transporter ATP-binding protein [Clostridiales bacterium]
MKKGVIKRLWKVAGKYRFIFALSIVCSLICVVAQLYLPILFGKATDLIIDKGQVDLPSILKIGISGAICALIAGLTQWINEGLSSKIANGITKNLRIEAFKRLQKVPLSYIDERPIGDVLSVEIGDADKMSEGLLLGFSKFFTGILTIIITLVFMAVINPIIAGIVVVITPISLFVAKFITGKTYKFFKNQSKITGSQTALIEETLTNLPTVKAYANEDTFAEKFDQINAELKEVSFKAVFFSSLTNPVTRFVNSLVYSAVALSGALIALNGGVGIFVVTAGSILSLLSYANRYTKPFNEITSVMTELSSATACASRIFSIIDQEEEIDGGENQIDFVKGEVEAKGVYFSYNEEQKLIEDFNLKVESGQKIAIVGPTGCGKTTLINLLMRFYELNSGNIYIDGKDITSLTRENLRKSYGMVLQDTWIRNATVKENIKIGKKDATDEEIVRAAKRSNAHGFIKRLEKGYDTVIGEAGLSQGQKQLLCIARVMLALPPMLILDEATSSIDTRTEMKIQEAFDELTKGKTSFIVAHRLSTVKSADKILVMKDGNVIEQGRHDELLKAKGFYYGLYKSQFES